MNESLDWIEATIKDSSKSSGKIETVDLIHGVRALFYGNRLGTNLTGLLSLLTSLAMIEYQQSTIKHRTIGMRQAMEMRWPLWERRTKH
jgi:hypothetical protein